MRTSAISKASVPSFTPLAENTKAIELLKSGNELWESSKINDAITKYKESISIHPSGDAYYNLGNCFYCLGEIENAKESWESSLKLDLARSDAHVNLANVYALNLKDFENANTHYEAALRLNGEDGQIHYNYAVVLDAQGNLEECIQHYQKARKLGVPVDKNLRNAMAKLIGKEAKKD